MKVKNLHLSADQSLQQCVSIFLKVLKETTASAASRRGEKKKGASHVQDGATYFKVSKDGAKLPSTTVGQQKNISEEPCLHARQDRVNALTDRHIEC